MSKKHEEEIHQARSSTRRWLGLAIAIAVVMVGLIAWDWYFSTGWPDRGVRGDFWGGHLAAGTGIVSACLFLAALSMQRRELIFQRRDIDLQLDEMIASREANRDQATALAAQTKQLELQNGLTRERDSLQFMLSLASQADRGHRSHGAPDPIRDLVAEQIVGQGAIDKVLAESMFRVFVAVSSIGGVYLIDALKNCALKSNDADIRNWIESVIERFRTR